MTRDPVDIMVNIIAIITLTAIVITAAFIGLAFITPVTDQEIAALDKLMLCHEMIRGEVADASLATIDLCEEIISQLNTIE